MAEAGGAGCALVVSAVFHNGQSGKSSAQRKAVTP